MWKSFVFSSIVTTRFSQIKSQVERRKATRKMDIEPMDKEGPTIEIAKEQQNKNMSN